MPYYKIRWISCVCLNTDFQAVILARAFHISLSSSVLSLCALLTLPFLYFPSLVPVLHELRTGAFSFFFFFLHINHSLLYENIYEEHITVPVLVWPLGLADT